MQVGDRVKMKTGFRPTADEPLSGDEIGDVIRVYRLTGDDEVERVDVRFPSHELPLLGRLESEFDLVQPSMPGSTY